MHAWNAHAGVEPAQRGAGGGPCPIHDDQLAADHVAHGADDVAGRRAGADGVRALRRLGGKAAARQRERGRDGNQEAVSHAGGSGREAAVGIRALT